MPTSDSWAQQPDLDGIEQQKTTVSLSFDFDDIELKGLREVMRTASMQAKGRVSWKREDVFGAFKDV